ncbi:uncharacterized protein LOC111879643 [Lactuca sativa]|uniref:uncharacterized protein LOC111879643 n=1 Tax=Lactuca sativa TaxID=4236 RepID=UPI000CD81529|nr:uncharacterized protein LOC111879643 [Lactuca sativa]
MSDGEDGAGPSPVRVKEIGSTTVACPMLNSTNYTVWSMRMKVVLKIHKAWTVIDPGTEKNEEKDYLAMGLLYQAIPESLTMQIGDVDSSKVLWESIKARYVEDDRVKEARLQTLNAEFDRLKMMESETIDAYVGKLSGIASKSAALGEVIDESKLVKKFLKTLPRSKFIHIVSSLEQVLDLKSVGFEDVVVRLKAYEERIKEEDISEADKSKVLFVKSTSEVGGSSDGGGISSGTKENGKWKGTSEVNRSNGTGGSSGSGSSGLSGSGGSGGPKRNNGISQSNWPNKQSNSDLSQSNSNNCKKWTISARNRNFKGKDDIR